MFFSVVKDKWTVKKKLREEYNSCHTLPTHQ